MKINQILVIIATITVISVNFLATAGYIGGVTPEVISNKYQTFLTPAGYAFSIWGWIYLGLIAFSIFQALPSQSEKYQKIRGLYLLSCVANCTWIWLWHHEMIGLSLGAILVLLATLAAINFSLKQADSRFLRVPFGLYFGWLNVASLANFAILLKSNSIEISQSVAAILIIAVTIIAVFVHLRIKNAAYGLAIAWAITAIAVKYGGIAIISVASILAIITLLITVITPFLRLNETKR
jgi:hypothetical protein